MGGVPIPTSEEEVLEACEGALRMAPEQWPPTLPPSKELLGAPAWYPFEHQAWPIGESIRQASLQTPRFKKNPRLLEGILRVATCANLRQHGNPLCWRWDSLGLRAVPGPWLAS